MVLIWLQIFLLILINGFTPGSSQDSSEDHETSIKPYLLLANTFDIRRLNFDGTDYRFLTAGLSETVALDYDYSTGYMYFSHNDGQTTKISRAPLSSGYPVTDIITTSLGAPDGLAVDWVNRKLFWTDGALNLIEKSNVDGSQRGVLISSGTHKPRGIALDPHADYMYFTDVGDTAPSIQRARMSDGFYRQIIINSGLLRPNGLTIDYEESRLYFGDAHTDKLESCNLDGTNRRVILDRPSTFHPYALSLFHDRLYWSDILQHHIMNADKNTGSSRVRIEGYFAYPTALHVVHPSRQLLESKICLSVCLSVCVSVCFNTDKNTGSSRVRIEGYFAYPTALHVVHPSRQLLENRDWCEANEGLGSCQHVCRNIYNGFVCTCLQGFEPVHDDPNNCQDYVLQLLPFLFSAFIIR
ncbi:low-density lipoprotein receptor-related protein 6-like [Amphiura filiformis]|uniref:low-density lipoprotein receptor-related protein 6-like n=1 Tax=Amphiura filiformis TaxID=82378 RepID=UPI003B2215DB